MTKIAYIEKRFAKSSQIIIAQANVIIDDYIGQGFDLTLRQLYYQFVARGWIENKQKNYNRIKNIVSDARLAGLISWDAIVDRTRNLRGNTHWQTPTQVLKAARNSFYMNRWRGQERRVEVWIEKDALVGVIEKPCADLDVSFFSCRGYSSQSETWAAGQRMLRYEQRGLWPVIIHLGDHDPSGVDMTRDIEDRLEMFGCRKTEVRRVALNMPQVEELKPPPNPTKFTDSRAHGYVTRFGEESWELDALTPDYINKLIRHHVEGLRDDSVLQDVIDTEQRHLATIDRLIEKAMDGEV